MKKIGIIAVIMSLIVAFHSCEQDKDIDNQKPVIDLSIQDAFPVSCDTLYFGETFILKVKFSDNVQLGSYSIDIHNNFDHHSHSTEVTECNLDPIKEPVNPFTLIQDYDIPAGQQEYETNLSITIPSSNSTGSFDEGDYHFFISLTDKEGWSAQKGLSIKLVKR
jgi:hypothetical protein